MAFEAICPDRIDLIHKNYRKLVNLLADVDEWGQVSVINMLTRYARTQFVDPSLTETVRSCECACVDACVCVHACVCGVCFECGVCACVNEVCFHSNHPCSQSCSSCCTMSRVVLIG